MEELVSVIIPVYNVEAYLRECVDSIVNQTYKNLEIILVDDGSTDNSGKMCDEYAKKDNRIKVFHKTNGGQSDARNFGIEVATGDYLYFLDSDDAVPKCAIKKLVDCCKRESADVSFSGIKRFARNLPNMQQYDASSLTLNEIETIRKMLLNDGCGHEPVAKLYKKTIWENERFPKGQIYEDYATLYKVISKCEKIVHLKESLYWYRIRTGSTMHSKLTSKNMQLLDIADEVTKYLKENVPDVENEAKYLQMVTYLKLMKGILDNGFSAFPEEQARIKNYVASCRPLLKMKFARKKDIIKAKSLLFSKHLFYVIYSIGEKTHI